MAHRYTTEEDCEFMLNDDDFEEMESADSLDDSFSDSSSSNSETDPEHEIDFTGKTVKISK